MKSKVFLDTSYAIALTNPADTHHHHALKLADFLESQGVILFTTQAVATEIGNAFAQQRYRQAGIQLLNAIEADPQITIVPVDDLLFQRALRLYGDRPDKEWGMTDCISFIVMQDQSLTDALTADRHFQQARFCALLREPVPE